MEVISAENYVDGGERLQILTTLFQERYGHRPDIVVRVPGDHLGLVISGIVVIIISCCYTFSCQYTISRSFIFGLTLPI